MFAEGLARLEHRIRPFIANLSPGVQAKIFSAGRRHFLELLAHESVPKYEPDKSLERVLWGVPHQGPLMWAAGVDKAGKLYHVSANQGAAAHMVGTTTAESWKGNVKDGIRNPFVPLSASGNALNWLGLPNEGHEVVAGRVLAYRRQKKCPVWASVMETPDKELPYEKKRDGVLAGFRAYEGAKVHVLERNKSCPNTAHAQGDFKNDLMYESERFVRESSIPVGVKLSIDTKVGDVPAVLDVLFELGYKFVNFGNSSTDYTRAREKLSAGEKEVFDFFTRNFGGGFTGRALKDKSLELCARAVEYVKAGGPGCEFHVVRTGGVERGLDLVESDQAGVSMNQWVTGYWGNFGKHGHRAYQKILREYERAK